MEHFLHSKTLSNSALEKLNDVGAVTAKQYCTINDIKHKDTLHSHDLYEWFDNKGHVVAIEELHVYIGINDVIVVPKITTDIASSEPVKVHRRPKNKCMLHVFPQRLREIVAPAPVHFG